MKRIVCLPRGQGKTTAMVQAAKATDGIIVTFSVHEAERIRKKYDLPEDKVYGCHEDRLRKRMLMSPVYVDNVENVLEELLGTGAIEGISWTPPEQPFVPVKEVESGLELAAGEVGSIFGTMLARSELEEEEPESFDYTGGAK